MFAGNKKVGFFIFANFEKSLVKWCIPRIPPWIETYHLTLSTITWCFFIILFGYLAQFNILWFWGSNIMIVLQYITDLFDGSLGRYRETGLLRWGYYMDHFLDYIFLCSILIGYSFLFNDKFHTLFFILASSSAFMVNSFLSFAVTNEFRVSYFGIGPTEVRLLFIIANIFIIFSQKHVVISSLLPFFFWGSMIGLIVIVYKTQKHLWEIDMLQKQSNEVHKEKA